MRKRVTFEVDDTRLSDVLKAVSGETGFLGDYMVSALMGETKAVELNSMAVYGVVYVGTETVEDDPHAE